MASPAKKPRTEQDDEFVTNCIRALAVDTVQKANSGHPGAPMGMAPIANILFGETLTYDPKHPEWHNRDRFVLSNGHASALIYTMLHVAGYKVTMDDLKAFRQMDSITPGHPERGITPGVEVTTGPLGQGISNAVGLAIAEAHLAAVFNKPGYDIVDHHTYVFCGDGCLMEGVAQESLSLAGHLALEKLIVVYDDNFISIDGSTELAYTEKKEDKYRALGFHTIVVSNGDSDYAAMRNAIAEAKAVRGKPKMILLRTTIGKGAKLQNTAKVHGSPLGAEEVARVKKEVWGRDPAVSFFVDAPVYAHFAAQAAKGADRRAAWETLLAAYKKQFPEEGKKYDAFFSGAMPADWESRLPRNADKVATRQASEKAMGVLLSAAQNWIGGSADLTGSNLTRPGEAAMVDFQKATPAGRYLRFGVREHGMCAVMNGIDAHGGLRAFGGTFLNFISYALGSVRLAAMSHHGVVYVATHDSIGLGEDGPTHQPVETLASLRATPNILVLRPADQTETSAAWAVAVANPKRPSCLALSRHAVAPLANSSFEGVKKGGYVVDKEAAGKLDVIFVSSGTEVCLCVEAKAKLAGTLNARVVSFPSWELFAAQPEAYQREVLGGAPVLSVEPFNALGWERYAHAHAGVPEWGASAPAGKIYEKFGLTGPALAERAKVLVKKYDGQALPPRPVNLLA